MDSRFLTLLLFILTHTFVGSAQDNSIISGKISGEDDGVIGLVIDKLHLGQAKQTTTSQIKKGAYSFKLGLTNAAFGNLTFKNQTLPFFVESGDQLSINFHGDSLFEKASFGGKAQANNHFLLEFTRYFSKQLSASIVSQNIQAFSIDAFEIWLYDNRAKMKLFLKKHELRNELTPDFKVFFNEYIGYYYKANLLAFAIEKSGSQLSVTELPSLMLDGVSDLSSIKQEKYQNPFYYQYLDLLTTYKAASLAEYKFENSTALLEKKSSVALKDLSGETYAYTLAKALFDHCGNSSTGTVKDLFSALKEADAKQMYAPLIKKRCLNAIEAKEAKRVKSEIEIPEEKASKSSKSKYDFTMAGLNGKKMKLEDFKGKVLYVDFWASWCGPCRQEFPHAKELKSMLSKDQKKQVEFLYISIDNSESKWREAIERYQIEGTHAHSAGNLPDGAARFFNVSSIPRYMIFDQKGNVVDANAKRPSSRDLVLKDILQLLK